jgi:hypothetical protein
MIILDGNVIINPGNLFAKNYFINWGKFSHLPPCQFRELPILVPPGKWYGIKIPLFFAKL